MLGHLFQKKKGDKMKMVKFKVWKTVIQVEDISVSVTVLKYVSVD